MGAQFGLMFGVAFAGLAAILVAYKCRMRFIHVRINRRLNRLRELRRAREEGCQTTDEFFLVLLPGGRIAVARLPGDREEEEEEGGNMK